jgi:hypothetical protein
VCLSQQDLFELGGWPVAQRRVQPLLVVDLLNEPLQAASRLGQIAVLLAEHLLVFQGFHPRLTSAVGERKRLVRLLLEDVTLIRNSEITAHVRFKGGITQTLTVPLPLNAWQLRITSPEVVAEIDRLLDHNTNLQIASLLNDRGLRSGEGKSFTSQIVARIRRRSGLTSRYDRLRKAGMLTVEEMAVVLGISPQSVKIWNRHGLLRSHACNDKNDCLFEHPGKNPPLKAQGRKLSERRLVNEIAAQGAQEVQYEA